MDTLKIYVGYDPREDIAWQVCRFSILRHTISDVMIYPLKLATLREAGLYVRGPDNASTEFSLTRFLTPYLAAQDGWSIYMDCDFLLTKDIATVLDGISSDKAVYCVQHNYTPARAFKMDGEIQSVYPRKNWSSFMLFNGKHPSVQALTPTVVNTQSPAYLHRLQWLGDDMIGALDHTWNFLEGESEKPYETPAAIHFTNGGPWFDKCRTVDFAEEWIAERRLYEELPS